MTLGRFTSVHRASALNSPHHAFSHHGTLTAPYPAGPDAVKELFAAAGPRLGFAANVAKLPGFAQAFGFLYKQLSIYRFPISNAATKAKETIGKE